MSLLRSPWVLHFSSTSCNGCDIEVLAALTPRYDVERFGIVNKGNPKFADVLLVSGAVNPRTAQALRNLYEQMPEPKAVVVVGSCGSTGGVFHDCYNVLGGVDRVLPVDVYVPGCPARPEAIIDGVVKALGILKERLEKKAAGASGPGRGRSGGAEGGGGGNEGEEVGRGLSGSEGRSGGEERIEEEHTSPAEARGVGRSKEAGGGGGND